MAKWVRCRLLLTAGSSTEVDVEQCCPRRRRCRTQAGIWDGILHPRGDAVAGRYAGGWCRLLRSVLRELSDGRPRWCAVASGPPECT